LCADKRAEIICKLVSQRPDLDLFVTAGYAVDEKKRLEDLFSKSEKRPYIVAEVQRDAEVPNGMSPHRLFLIAPDGKLKSLGRQAFATSLDVADPASPKLKDFEALIEEKTAETELGRLFAICCGEINVVKGRNVVSCRSALVEQAILQSDIIINPTHDRMGNAGTLIAKRRWLSAAAPPNRRIYVSCSNWNAAPGNGGGVQSQSAPTLHTVFVNGQSIQPMSNPIDHSDDFEYREWEVH
jgi:hypothetical protein